MNIKNKKLNEEEILKKNKIEKKTEKEKVDHVSFLQNEKIESLKSKLLHNQKKISDIELRKLANIENIKKQTEEKIKNIKQKKIETFLEKIIPIIDSLENIANPSNKIKKEDPLIKGIELTLESLLNILLKLGVTIEGKKNELFNPNIHTPILVEASEETKVNHVISIVKTGFTFNKVVLRKAIVTIPKN